VSLRRALELEPRDFKVLIVTANTLCALGEAREAVAFYQRALEIEPRSVEAQNNLGNAFQELGECAQAAGCYRLALAVKPNDPETLCNLSNALRRLGHLDEARDCSQRAIALQPALSLAHNNLGLVLAGLGRRAEAVASFRQAVSLAPRSVDSLNNLGSALCALGESGEAATIHRTAIALDPQRAESHFNLATALYGLGMADAAVASYRRALELRPRYALAQLGLATALRALGRAVEAEAACSAVLDAQADHGAALCLLGDLYTDRGEFARAQELFQRALDIDEEFAPALCSIAAHRRMTPDDGAWLRAAERRLEKPLPLEHEIGLRYALGKYFDDLARYDAAFDRYRAANELCRRHESTYDVNRLAGGVDRIIARCDRAFVHDGHSGASQSELPVLVVGMPRSGTSLLEQILASHSQAYGAGEVNFWEDAFAAFAGSGASAFAQLARQYLERLGAHSGQALRVIDKMPANFLYAGLIHAVFPRARIIHVRRHPLDTCLSIYFQNFFHLHPYAADLELLVGYYRQYQRVSDYWRAVLPAHSLLEIRYEELIADQEHWTRRMLEFVGLPWDPRCLDFHATRRVVLTASRWQVRQRINAASIGRWRHYEKHLGPLRQLLPPGET
jgi:tetratricopeptide (TPR) repeat protein